MCNKVIDNNQYDMVPIEWLEEDSYTVSYSLAGSEQEQGWVSFHDYQADYAVSLHNESLLLFYNQELYLHNVGAKGVFFGYRYNSSITPVFVPRLFDKGTSYPFGVISINWNTDIEDEQRRLLMETWSSISLHNSFQGTRQTPITLFRDECSLIENYGNFNTRRIKNRWYYNFAFNEKVSPDMRTYIERLDRFLPINTASKKCTFADRMFDDFLIVHLIFNNEDDRNLFQYEINLEFKATTQ